MTDWLTVKWLSDRLKTDQQTFNQNWMVGQISDQPTDWRLTDSKLTGQLNNWFRIRLITEFSYQLPNYYREKQTSIDLKKSLDTMPWTSSDEPFSRMSCFHIRTIKIDGVLCVGVIIIKHERQCFMGIFKHWEENWKYNGEGHIFDKIQSVWIADETLSQAFDISEK